MDWSWNSSWTYEQAVSYYKFAIINYIGFHDKGMVLAGGCGDTNGKPQIDKTTHLQEAYEFGKIRARKAGRRIRVYHQKLAMEP